MKLKLSWILVAALAFISLSGCTLSRHRDAHGNTHKTVWVPGLGIHEIHKHKCSNTYYSGDHDEHCNCR